MVLKDMLNQLKYLSDCFVKNGIYDIYTNSKIFEVLIAEQFGHKLVNGHANTPDARDELGNFYEYKHFKMSSSNHTWTFNDYSVQTIQKLQKIKTVYFTVIDDSYVIPQITEAYCVSGQDVAHYLLMNIPYIVNKRRMINISVSQIISQMYYKKIAINNKQPSELLINVFETIHEMETTFNIAGLLTSNKLWELLVACKLGHNINSEQKKHDAIDANGNTFEYKVAIRPMWTFQDISDNVLDSYLNDYGIVLAIVDKRNFIVKRIYMCNPRMVVKVLQGKMYIKLQSGREIRRLSAVIGMKDVREMLERREAEWLL